MSKRKTTSEFIRDAKKIHGDRYIYSEVDYIDAFTKVCVICPKHGKFYVTPHDHYKGNGGCVECKKEKISELYLSNTKEFLEKLEKIHPNKYDTSKVKYVKSHEKVCLICPKHGEFWAEPNHLLNGSKCPKCKMSKLENEINILLTENNIDFKYDVRNLSFLKGLTLDFYLPKHNIGIECQGIQHFEESKIFSKEKVEDIQLRDKTKSELCKENGITLLYYSNLKIDYPYEVITDKNKLLKIIKSYE